MPQMVDEVKIKAITFFLDALVLVNSHLFFTLKIFLRITMKFMSLEYYEYAMKLIHYPFTCK